MSKVIRKYSLKTVVKQIRASESAMSTTKVDGDEAKRGKKQETSRKTSKEKGKEKQRKARKSRKKAGKKQEKAGKAGKAEKQGKSKEKGTGTFFQVKTPKMYRALFLSFFFRPLPVLGHRL